MIGNSVASEHIQRFLGKRTLTDSKVGFVHCQPHHVSRDRLWLQFETDPPCTLASPYCTIKAIQPISTHPSASPGPTWYVSQFAFLSQHASGLYCNPHLVITVPVNLTHWITYIFLMTSTLGFHFLQWVWWLRFDDASCTPHKPVFGVHIG